MNKHLTVSDLRFWTEIDMRMLKAASVRWLIFLCRFVAIIVNARICVANTEFTIVANIIYVELQIAYVIIKQSIFKEF